jgi:hypothetical protein
LFSLGGIDKKRGRGEEEKRRRGEWEIEDKRNKTA